MEGQTAFRTLERFFFHEWVDFLWSYKRTSPLLFSYMAFGAEGLSRFSERSLPGRVEAAESLVKEAREDFQQTAVSFFWRCNIVDPTRRPKHWRVGRQSDAAILKASAKTKESIFFSIVTVPLLQQGLWVGFSQIAAEVKKKRGNFFVIDFGQPIGGAKGQSTSLVRYEISYSSIEAHAYPILASELKRHPLIVLSDLGLKIVESN